MHPRAISPTAKNKTKNFKKNPQKMKMNDAYVLSDWLGLDVFSWIARGGFASGYLRTSAFLFFLLYF